MVRAPPRPMSIAFWRLRSMFKPITGVTAMSLMDGGKLELGQPIGDMNPALGRPMVLVDPNGRLNNVPPATR